MRTGAGGCPSRSVGRRLDDLRDAIQVAIPVESSTREIGCSRAGRVEHLGLIEEGFDLAGQGAGLLGRHVPSALMPLDEISRPAGIGDNRRGAGSQAIEKLGRRIGCEYGAINERADGYICKMKERTGSGARLRWDEAYVG